MTLMECMLSPGAIHNGSAAIPLASANGHFINTRLVYIQAFQLTHEVYPHNAATFVRVHPHFAVHVLKRTIV